MLGSIFVLDRFYISGSAAARLLGLQVLIPPRIWTSVFGSVACCLLEIRATGQSIIQRDVCVMYVWCVCGVV